MQNKEDLEKQYIMEQLRLKDKINRANCVNLKELKYIAGVDGQDTCTNIVFVATDGML